MSIEIIGHTRIVAGKKGKEKVILTGITAILYRGTSAVGACAGSADGVQKWIEKVQLDEGKQGVSGWNVIAAMAGVEKEEAEKRRTEEMNEEESKKSV